MTDCHVCSEPLRRGDAECPQCGCRAPPPTRRWGFVLVRLMLVLAMAALILPGFKLASSGDSTRLVRHRLGQIGVALQQYHADHGTFPPAYVVDAHGKPLHSWRVLLLPYLGETSLYAEYDFGEAWDGPHNRLLLARKPRVYAVPGDDAPSPNTAFAAVVGRLCVMRGMAGSPAAEIEDRAHSVIAGETVAEIPWTKPEDVAYDYKPLGSPGFFGSRYLKSGAHFVTADGSVHLLAGETVGPRLRFWFTREREHLGPEFPARP